MKKYLLILLFGITTQVFSQGRDDQYTPPVQQSQTEMVNGTSVNMNMYKANKYKKMMTKGIVLTSVGAVCGVGGAILLENGINTFNSVNSGSMFAPGNGGPQIVCGAALAVVGAVGVCLGTPLTIVGAVKSKKYKQQLSLLFTPTGCKVAYTF